ncbi:MAG: hypothetical protein VX502_04370, partial [Candidatus Thermoplasmatota archaeon]|nr:hypothetical protein [Candidatus Thermoplasmatota archaeon]
MGDELTREEVTERLEAIYSEALEGKDLKKRLANIPKTLDKYEGKWPGLLKAAGKKFAKADSDELGDSEENNDSEDESEDEEPADSEDEAEEESAEEGVTESEVEKPAKKRGGFLSRFGKSKDEDPVEDESEDEEPADSEDEAEEEPDDVEDEALEWT